MKKFYLILLSFSILLAKENIYAYIIFKTKYYELKNIYLSFTSAKDINYRFSKPVKQTYRFNKYTLFSDIETNIGEYHRDSADIGIEININNLYKKPLTYSFHSYSDDIQNTSRLFSVYSKNFLSLNYSKNRYLESMKNMFEYFAKYYPKYKYSVLKYDFKFQNAKKYHFKALKTYYINEKKLKKLLNNRQKRFIKSLLTSEPEIFSKIKSRMKLYVTKKGSQNYITASLNLKYPFSKDTSEKLAKLKMINGFEKEKFLALNYADEINRLYLQFRQTMFDINYNFAALNYKLLKLKNGMNVNFDTLSGIYLKIYKDLYTLNDISYKNNKAYLNLKKILKDLNEY